MVLRVDTTVTATEGVALTFITDNGMYMIPVPAVLRQWPSTISTSPSVHRIELLTTYNHFVTR